jgi:hypothetical protein
MPMKIETQFVSHFLKYLIKVHLISIIPSTLSHMVVTLFHWLNSFIKDNPILNIQDRELQYLTQDWGILKTELFCLILLLLNIKIENHRLLFFAFNFTLITNYYKYMNYQEKSNKYLNKVITPTKVRNILQQI